MFHINKFKDLCTISLRFKQFCTDAICQKRRNTFFQDTIFQYRLQKFVVNLTVQLMLTARYRQNHLCIPLDSFCKCIVCRFVTGMERHDHIDFLYTFIICDITMQKMQLVIAVFSGKAVTFLNNVFFQIKSDDIDIVSFEFFQIVIHGKCQIRFATSEIQNRDLPFSGQRRKNILNKFQKTVDLLKFVIRSIVDFALAVHHTEIHKKRNRRPLFQNVLFYPVVRLNPDRFQRRMLFDFDCLPAFFADQNRAIHASSLCLKLRETAFAKVRRHIGNDFFLCMIRVKYLRSHRRGCLITDTAFQFDRAYPHTGRSIFVLASLTA